VLRAATRLTTKVAPVLPAGVKRLLSGRRAVVVDGNTLDPTLQFFLAGERALGVTGLVVDDDVAETRALTHDSCVALGGPLAPVGVRNLSIPGPAGPIGARHYRPSHPGTAALLVYYHGGGFVFGDLDSFDAFCAQMCHGAGVHVLSVDYRLAPEHKAPAAVDDAYAAFRWASEHAAELGADPGRVAVGGDSAGGALAAVVSQLARDSGGPRPCLQLLNYPITDFDADTRSRTLFAAGFLLTRHDMDFFHRQYLDGSGLEPTDPRISPMLADDLSGLPPAVVVTAGFDPLRDEGNHYAAALADAGVPVDLRQYGSMIHAFINFGGLGGGTSHSIADIASALKTHLGGS
jgi:acetyl esterase